MLLDLIFEDLNDFVAAFQGRLSLEGMVVVSETDHAEGTILDLKISLDDSLVLVRGKAMVVRTTGSGARFEHVLKLLELDDESIELIERMDRRGEESGVAVFDLEHHLANHETDELPASRPPEPEESVRKRESEDVYRAVSSALELPAAEPVDATGETQGSHDAPQRRRTLRIALAAVATLAVAAAVIGMRFCTEQPPPSEPVPSATAEPTPAPPEPTETQVAAILSDRPTEPPAEPIPRSDAGPATALTSVRWQATAERTEVTLRGNGDFVASRVVAVRLEDAPGPRLLIRLIGVQIGDTPLTHRIAGPGVDRIRLWQHDEFEPSELYVVFDLSGATAVTAPPRVEGGRVLVVIEPR